MSIYYSSGRSSSDGDGTGVPVQRLRRASPSFFCLAISSTRKDPRARRRRHRAGDPAGAYTRAHVKFHAPRVRRATSLAGVRIYSSPLARRRPPHRSGPCPLSSPCCRHRPLAVSRETRVAVEPGILSSPLPLFGAIDVACTRKRRILFHSRLASELVTAA